MRFDGVQGYFELLCVVEVLELSACKDVAHPDHFFDSNHVFDATWNLRSHDFDQLPILVVVAIGKAWGANLLIQFALQYIVYDCFVNGRPSSEKTSCPCHLWGLFTLIAEMS